MSCAVSCIFFFIVGGEMDFLKKSVEDAKKAGSKAVNLLKQVC